MDSLQNDTGADISPPSKMIRETLFFDEPEISASRELALRPFRRIKANAPIDVHCARKDGRALHRWPRTHVKDSDGGVVRKAASMTLSR